MGMDNVKNEQKYKIIKLYIRQVSWDCNPLNIQWHAF